MKTCEDCGCRVYNGFCTNCDEETFIADQYYELGESLPIELSETVNEQRIRRDRRLEAA